MSITQEDLNAPKRVREYCEGREDCTDCEFKPGKELCMLNAPNNWEGLSTVKIKEDCVWREDETWFYSSCNNGKKLKPTGWVYEMAKSMTHCFRCGRKIKWKD